MLKLLVIDGFNSIFDHVEISPMIGPANGDLVQLSLVQVVASPGGTTHLRQSVQVSRSQLADALADTASLLPERSTIDLSLNATRG